MATQKPLNKMNVQEKEQLIIGTIIDCNSEISKLSGVIKNVSLMEKNNLYHFNMVQLYKSLNESDTTFGDFDTKLDVPVYTKNLRNNYYAYFQKVHKFLDGFEPNMQRNLNEGLQTDSDDISSIDIYSFKEDLKNIIKELESKNDLENLSEQIYKIKTFAGRPIFIYGYDICNNVALRKELFESFKIDHTNLISICFDKSNKQILFIQKNSLNIVCYDLKTDTLDYYNKVNGVGTNGAGTNAGDTQIKGISFDGPKYLQQLKELIHNNIVELYINPSILELKFEDNLYFDKIRAEMQANTAKMGSVVKK